MSSIDDVAAETPPSAATRMDQVGEIAVGFSFVPSELILKCRSLIESFHAMYGYVGLPDMLWLSDARDIIERDAALAQIFKKASKSRGAKRANDSFLMIATAIVSVEVLARDVAGWGKRFPAAKRTADKLVGEASPNRRTWLMDQYFYPPFGGRREHTDAIAPSTALPLVAQN